MKKLSSFAPIILRLGLVPVFIWFGYNQLIDSSLWVSLIPSWVLALTGMTAKTFVIANGVFEIAMAILLALGIKVRLVATLLFLHMFFIIVDVGINGVGVRDFGLMMALLSVACIGPDRFSIDPIKDGEK